LLGYMAQAKGFKQERFKHGGWIFHFRVWRII
jgi:hypothetical protein